MLLFQLVIIPSLVSHCPLNATVAVKTASITVPGTTYPHSFRFERKAESKPGCGLMIETRCLESCGVYSQSSIFREEVRERLQEPTSYPGTYAP